MTNRLFIPALIYLICAFALPADSLVPSGFSGYLTSEGAVTAGSLIRVTINSETRMSFSSSLQDDTRVNITFTGGEGEGLFNFLPSGEAGNSSSAEGDEESLLETELAARVVEIAGDGSFLLRGSREISIDRATQRVEIEGWGSMAQVDENGRIPFGSLADAVLRYSTFTNGAGDVVGGNDLEEIRTPVPEDATQVQGDQAATAGVPGQPPAAGAEPQAPAGAAAPPATAEPGETAGTGQPTRFDGYTLSRDLKRELLLQYVNQLVDLLFDPSAN